MMTHLSEDRGSAAQVLRFRIRDGLCWAAMALAIAIPILGQSSGTYRSGSLTDYANVYGPPVFLALLAFAGVRWCWLGRSLLQKEARLTTRLLVDLPGVLVASFATWVVVMVVLGLFGVIELD